MQLGYAGGVPIVEREGRAGHHRVWSEKVELAFRKRPLPSASSASSGVSGGRGRGAGAGAGGAPVKKTTLTDHESISLPLLSYYL